MNVKRRRRGWDVQVTEVVCAILLLAVIARGNIGGVVNPSVRSPLRKTMSLDGEWEFVDDVRGNGDAERWFEVGKKWDGARAISVPGCWEAQGVGEEGPSHPAAIEESVQRLRNSYVGTGWYRKVIDLPDKWIGKNLWLKFGGVNAQGWVYVNGQLAGTLDTYCGTRTFYVGQSQPLAQMTVAVKVRNDVGSGKGLFNWVERFGGIYRSVELDATGPVMIERSWVETDLDAARAKVHVTVRGVTGARGDFPVRVNVYTADEHRAGTGEGVIHLNGETSEGVVEIAIDPLRAWSPEHPELYVADVVLSDGTKDIDGWQERFGVKKFEVREGHLYLNNERFYLRGFGDDFIYPATLCSPTSREAHLKHLRMAREYGFNYVRLHTHCELPEYFDAADEAGIIVQPELPYYGEKASAKDGDHFRPEVDLAELIENYRGHVALGTYCFGNEGWMGSPEDVTLYQLAKRLDPSRVVIHQDGGKNTRENSDWADVHVQHEFLNLATEEDPRMEGKFSGVVQPPRTMREFREEMAREGLPAELALRCFDSGQELQAYYQKRGIEKERMDGRSDGYVYWTMVDVGWPAAQGLLDPFWGAKRSSSEYFSRFNGEVALLMERDAGGDVYEGGERVRMNWKVSNFSSGEMRAAKVKWSVSSGKDVLAEGVMEGREAKAGALTELGTSEFFVPRVRAAQVATIRAEIVGTEFRNRWTAYLFPKREVRAGAGMVVSEGIREKFSARYPGAGGLDGEGDLIVTDVLSETIVRRMREGKNVLLIGLGKSFHAIKPGAKLGWWTMSGQTGTAVERHPAMGDFPNEGILSPAMFEILGESAAQSEVRGSTPIVLNHSGGAWRVHVFEAKVGKGKLLGCGMDLLADRAEANYLLGQMVDYVRSEGFRPVGKMEIGR